MNSFQRARTVWIRGRQFVQARQYYQVGFGPFAVGLLLAIACGAFSFASYATSIPRTVNFKLGGGNAARLLKDYAIIGATHNSGERYDPPKCHKDTRVAFLTDIRKEVARSFANATLPPVFWIHGPAGIGKTAIAQTLAEGWEKDRQLAASFFFGRTLPGRNEKDLVITTIAYQLSMTFPDMKPHLEKAIIDDPLFVNKSLSAQADLLIRIPLETLYLLPRNANPGRLKIIILDGLDEILDEAGQRAVLRVLVNMIAKRSLPLRRPELGIRETFDSFNENLILRWNMTQLDHDRDIQILLSSKFESIQCSRPWLRGPDLPPPNTLSILTQRPSGRFIYRVALMRYVGSSNEPENALQEVLGLDTPGELRE